MRLLVTISLLFLGCTLFAQDTAALKTAVTHLNEALVSKDQKALDQLLNNKLSYGHSNAWIQTKKEVFDDMNSGKLIYTKIENSSVTLVDAEKQYASVRAVTNVDAVLNGNPLQIKLHVYQFWIKTKKGWELLARQAVKL